MRFLIFSVQNFKIANLKTIFEVQNERRTSDMKKTEYDNLKDIITPQELADYLGLSRRTVYKLIKLGQIDTISLYDGSSIYLIEKTEIKRYIERRKNNEAKRTS